MSSTIIVALIFAGIFALLIIGYINHHIEKSKLERARRKVDLAERYRRCANLSAALPGQLMSAELKALLSRLELHYLEQLLTIEGKDAKLKARAEQLRALVNGKGDSADEAGITNPPLKITTDEQAKDVRFQLEGLQAQIVRGVQEKVLSTAQGKEWLGRLRHMLATVYIEYFNNVGQQLLAKNQPAQARLAFERGIQYLKKQNEPNLYKQPLQQFQEQLERANALVLEQTQQKTSQGSTLTAELETQGQQEDWKKKHIYD